MRFKIAKVPIKRIDKENFSFNITTNSSTEDIVESISCIGLLSYPYLVFKKNRYIIISGFRRINSYDYLKHTAIPAKVIYEKISRFECSKLAISDNAFQRTLNIVEMSRCYRILIDSVKGDISLIDRLGSSLGFMISTSAMEKIKPISSLNWSIQKGLIKGYLSLPTALKLGTMKVQEGGIFIKLFKILNTTLNNQREIIDLMSEVSIRNNISIKNLFLSEPIINILSSAKSCPQKVGFLRSYLKKLRYPTIIAVSDKFKENLRQLNLSKDIKLTPPRFFEGQIYNLSINFKSRIELRKHKEDINKIVNSQNILLNY